MLQKYRIFQKELYTYNGIVTEAINEYTMQISKVAT
jgi:hypothetical protein